MYMYVCIYIYIYFCVYIYSVYIYTSKKNHVHVHHATSHDGPFIQYLSEVIGFCHLCLADQRAKAAETSHS